MSKPNRNFQRQIKETETNRAAMDNRPAPHSDLPAISGRELCDLLAPIASDVFVSEYWGRKPLFIKGRPDKLEKLFHNAFDRAAFLRAANHAGYFHTIREIAGKQDFKNFLPKIHRLSPPGSVRTEPLPSNTQADQMEALIEARLAEGATALVYHPSEPWLITVAAAIKAQLNHPSRYEVIGVLSPEGGRVGAHIDKGGVIFVQCEGRMRIACSPEPVLEWPRETAAIFPDGTGIHPHRPTEGWENIQDVDMESLTEVVLAPGDVLYFPAGVVHATEAIGGYSVGLSFAFDHHNFFDLISSVLKNKLISNPAWRYLPAVNPASARPGALSAEVEQFLAARLEELRQAINALTPQALELNREWHKLIADPGRVNLAIMSPGPGTPSERPIQRQDVLCLSKRSPVKYAVGTDSDGRTTMHLFYADKEVTMRDEWAPFLRTLVHEEWFVAESTTNWAPEGQQYPWETVQKYLQALRDQGILEWRSIGDETDWHV